MQLQVTGFKFFKGDVEGRHYDSTKVFLLMPLDESKGTAKGFATVELPFGDSTEFARLKDIPCPFFADVDIQMVSTGSGLKQQVVAVTPIKPSKAA